MLSELFKADKKKNKKNKKKKEEISEEKAVILEKAFKETIFEEKPSKNRKYRNIPGSYVKKKG